jgi:hypothetical protein
VAGLAHRRRQHRQQADLCDEVGVHDRGRMRRVAFGPHLVAEDAEGDDRGGDRAVFGHQFRHQRGVRAEVVGVELDGVHRRGTRRLHRGDLLVEAVGATRGQHHCRARRQPCRHLDADFAATAEDHHQTAIRVLHGCQYVLR